MGEILDLAEALWTGKTDTYSRHPFGRPRGIEAVADRTWFYRGFSNAVVRETDDGLIIIDPAAAFDTKVKFDGIRSVTPQRLHTAIFTHGHNDHVFGVPDYVTEANANGWPLPRVIAHEAMPARFKRYRETLSWNAIINLRQFRGGVGEPAFSDDFYYPDITYPDRLDITVGGVKALLRHARGETDDHTWIFFPDTGVLCTGDLFIWSIPNGGNPQKVQRYAMEWALALRAMAALKPAVLLPGHGVPVMGEDRVVQALTDTADFLEAIHQQTVTLM
ncbi:MAG: MBL fold metallo-hydrolase, partial [Deltaproteobacteria bacterium]|nr:MBL fold metallo-hydrolase [Deltaproteobacteria bacterium]